MAVTFANPIIITASMGSSYKSMLAAAGYGSFYTLKIIKIYWFDPTSGFFTIIDPGDGSIWFQGAVEVSGQSQIFDFTAKPLLWRDFQVSALSSGTLYIYTD